MIEKTCASFSAEIFMAGDYDQARNVLRRWCFSNSDCWSIFPVDYIYTMGEEAGFCARRINYPRFPHTEEELKLKAINMAELLREELNQGSYSIVFTDETFHRNYKNE